MEILIFFPIFVFGLIFGSFLNCLIYRLEKGEGFLVGRSYCPNCKHILSWQDLIPIFSFIFLKGKCRYCSQKISLQYPLVELSTVILFLFSSIFSTAVHSIEEVVFWWIISCFLIIIFVYDLKHYLIPDQVIYPAIAIAFLYRLFGILNFGHWNLFGILRPLINPLFSAIFASAFFLLIVLVSRGHWMGFGDVKLAFFMGLFLGFPKIFGALFLAFFIGAIVGLILISLGKKTLKSEIPFGPFLVTGTFLSIFFGEKIIDWYLSFFLLK